MVNLACVKLLTSLQSYCNGGYPGGVLSIFRVEWLYLFIYLAETSVLCDGERHLSSRDISPV